MTEGTPDQLHAFDRELRQRDPRFVRVLTANPDDGQGEYELRTATGQTARLVFTFCTQHGRIVTPRFDEATRERLAATTYVAPDPYREGLAKLKAASSTPESRFEDEYKASRMRELLATREALDAEPPPPRLTAAEEAALAAAAPPNPYAAGIKALQEKETR